MESNPGLLPADVLLEVFSYFSYTDLLKIQFVCKWWQQISRQKYLWRNIVYKPGETDNTKNIIDNLKVSPSLQAIDLRYIKHCTITKELLEEVNRCPKLVKLAVFWDWLHNKHVVMKKIKILIVDIKEEDLDSFDNRVDLKYVLMYFPNLEHLDCSFNILRECDIEAYLKKKRRSLHTVGFHCETNGMKCIVPYLSLCKALKTLTLYCLCGQIGHLPDKSTEHLKQILSLTIRDSGWYTISDCLPMFRYFPNVVVLQFDKCDFCDEQAFLVVANSCPLIEKLTLSCLDFTDRNLKYVSNFKKLTFLCLKSNRYISDACVAHLQAISGLRHLDILDCEGLTPQCLIPLFSFDKLEILKFDLLNCDPPADLEATHVNNPDLHVMFYNCKDTGVLDRLRHQRVRISLLKGNPDC
ncbi:F-box/LRR-repeat protein fbxl-1 [Anabrus simplex]|uniref:F-box/LRR-repeat protein fbxl-1 n=1 Tax=Anabrus simplex TaxID=316456 RepID=UPI0035A3916E